MKVLLAFDSFKGSLNSWQAGCIAKAAIESVIPDAQCEVIALADGGEGTVDAAVRAVGGKYEQLQVTGPMGERIVARIGIMKDVAGELVAVLEVANICGLMMVDRDKLDPLAASSRGIGEAIVQLLDKGIRSFVIGLGGSVINDGGMGMLSALGAQFQDAQGESLLGSGADLLSLETIIADRLDKRLARCSFLIASDVNNPLCGSHGATLVYGPQKGVTPELAVKLDHAMAEYACKLEAALASCAHFQTTHSQRLKRNKDDASLSSRAGAGAAGGLGFAFMAIGGRMTSGARWLLDLNKLGERAKDFDLLVTGEGRSDRQTLHGKLPYQIAQLARHAERGCILISGSLGDGVEELTPYFQGCFSIMKEPATLHDCMEQAEQLLAQATRQIFQLIYFIHSLEK